MKLSLKSGRGTKIHIMLDGEYSMTADRDFILNAGLFDGMELSVEELNELFEKVCVRRAFNKACELLAVRDHSRYELYTKLRQKGCGDGAEKALDRLCELGYIDDEKFAVSFAAQLRENKGFGKRRIETELKRRGIDSETACIALEGLEDDGIEEVTAIIEKKYKNSLDDEKGLRRTVAALSRMGYGYSLIMNAVREYKSEHEDESF